MRDVKLRVLARPAFGNRDKNPYNFLLYSGLRDHGVAVDEFHAKNWLLRRYDVCHVHWPESTFNASLPEAIATTRTLLSALDWLKKRGTKIVWTAHDLAAHERRYALAEREFWKAFIPRIDAFFALSEASKDGACEHFPELARLPAFVVMHHHYRGEYPDGLTQSQARARLELPADAPVALFFGRVLAYKNVPGLIDVFRSLPATGGRAPILLVAGKPNDRESENAVRRAARSEPRIRMAFEFVPNDEAQVWFRAADLVVLPYREILNSGAAVLGLGFDRPVLLPHAGAGGELQRIVGSRWVNTYDRLVPEVLSSAFARAATLPKWTDGRHLDALSPESAVRSTLAAYETLIPGARSGRRLGSTRSPSPWFA